MNIHFMKLLLLQLLIVFSINPYIVINHHKLNIYNMNQYKLRLPLSGVLKYNSIRARCAQLKQMTMSA